jgi:hypothetical protein
MVLPILGGIALYVLLGLALWWFISPTTTGQKKDFAQLMTQTAGGAALLFGLYFTWRRVEISQDQQVTERFTRAIAQLGETDDKGKPKLEIRLGGIYALERIARDSPEDDLTVMEVLTAYVRQNSLGAYRRQKEPRADIRAIMHVIRRREEGHKPEKQRLRLDLSRADLSGADLSRAYLWYADLREAWLPEVNFTEADLRYANLAGAEIAGTNLKGAYLRRTNLNKANLRGANLGGAKLGSADLTKADFSGADLREAEELTQKQLEQAIGNTYTKLPKECNPPAAWT